MKVACGILAIFLLALNNNLISAYLLEPNEINDKHFEGPTPVWQLFFDTVSIENDIEHKGILQCFSHYKNRKVEIYGQAKRDIFQCLNISTWIGQKSFEAHFRKYLLHDIKNCKYESDDFGSYLECSANAVIRRFNDVNSERRRHILEETKFCMRAVVKKFLTDSRENNKELNYCLLGNVCPPLTPSTTTTPQLNTTFNPWDNSTTVSPAVNTTWAYNTTLLPNTTWSPWENTTYPPTTVNTTASPQWNTTLNPWDNSTTVSPAVNTTWAYNTTLLPTTVNTTVSPQLNTTWNPWQNSTLDPSLNTTLNPWANSTTISPIVNTTLSGNSTWNPLQNTTLPIWGNSTTVDPSKNSTLNPSLNSTSTPNESSATNDKTTPDSSLTQGKSASNWWKKTWGNISSLF